MQRPRVLFLCTGNSTRSQMAEAFLRTHGADRFEACSAGLHPTRLNPLTVRVMHEAGIDVSGQRSKGVDEYLGKMPIQCIITLCDDAEKNCPSVWPAVQTRLHRAFKVPSAVQGTEDQKVAAFRQVRNQIEKRIIDWLAGTQREA